MHPHSTPLKALAERWAQVPAREIATFQTYVTELLAALGLPLPHPGSGYEFEYPLKAIDRASGKASAQRIDLYRRGHFVMEAKHTDAGRSNELVLRAAYQQAKSYAYELTDDVPPFIMVMDVARTLIVWRLRGARYEDYTIPLRRIDLARLAENAADAEFLHKLWTDPESLRAERFAAAVTREVADRLARLSASLEQRGFGQERVARFLIRCVFTMFAEDVGLLKDAPFTTALREYGGDPDEFSAAMLDLWRAMDEGRRFGLKKLLRFNGHFFHDAEALPLSGDDLAVLLDAAEKDWTMVEPTIFGTLLTRALDPRERHRLGAEYTPREYVERVVRQAVEVPIRERWAPVKTRVLQLRETTGRNAKRDRDEALGLLREFHAWMRGLRFLDPACGSGNFLYVTLHLVKLIELEVLHEIAEVTGNLVLGLDEVHPDQFYGIEIKPWAREIAELTLWIGYHQFWMEHHKGTNPPEPVLKDTRTLEQRDAVLAWDEIVEVPEKSRPDPTPRITHPVTGKLVPDPAARLPYYEYRGARQAEWPQADFIVANPPYMGSTRQREEFGDGYVAALRKSYPEVPITADYVMYWWHRGARLVSDGATLRSGMITTNSITQSQNRPLVSMAAERGGHVVWAIADHPWVDEASAAAVRVAMTIVSADTSNASRLEVDEGAALVREQRASRLNADLSVSVDVAKTSGMKLISNSGVCSPGFKLHGAGFILSAAQAAQLLLDPQNHAIIRSYRQGRDLTGRPREVSVIDFALMDETQARQFPVLFEIVRNLVKPERDANARALYRTYWWRYGEPRRELRAALAGLPRYIATTETAKHRAFTFLGTEIVPDNMLVCIASSEAIELGILSSTIHVTWALAAGARLGVGNDPRYNKTLCFDPFPFPDPPKHLREQIGLVAEALDAHRKDALARDERVTMTGMYNVLEKLRSVDALTPKERDIHTIAACGVLRDLHDELDRLVAQAYGWPWPMEREEILERLVALHDERVEEEKRGIIRWLRPEYQIPRFRKGAEGPAPELDLPPEAPAAAEPAAAPPTRRPWPAGAVEQIAALKALAAAHPHTPEEATVAFDGAKLDLVRRHLETLELVGELRAAEDGRYGAVAEPL